MEEFMGFDEPPIELPPGFRFHPTDEELITHYLCPKVADDSGFRCTAIGEVDLNRVEPWDLPWKAKMGEKEWYFFCVRDRKYPTGSRTNRATVAGYWKATGKDKEIFQGKALVGMKKTLVFYRGRAPTGLKTNWVMHEYRLEGQPIIYKNLPQTSKKEWVICRVFNKCAGGKKVPISRLVRSADSDMPSLTESSPEEDRVRTRDDVSCFFKALDDNPHDRFTCLGLVQESGLVSEQLVLQRLIESNVPGTKQSRKTEPFLQDISCNEVVFKHYEDVEFPMVSEAPVDLDCLWNY